MRRKLIRHFLKKRGLTIVPLQSVEQGPNLKAALSRLKSWSIPFETIIDVGASNGGWTEVVLPFFPAAKYLCIEAQPAHEPALSQFAARHPGVQYVLAAAGAEEGEIFFDASDLFGGIASYTSAGKSGIVVPMTTIDRQVEQRALRPPYLIKLDTHGFELPILAGAEKTLRQTEALIVEVYNFKPGATGEPFWEMCRILGEKGFRCIDMFDHMYRPHDQVFWQMDMTFARSSRPEFAYSGYQ